MALQVNRPSKCVETVTRLQRPPAIQVNRSTCFGASEATVFSKRGSPRNGNLLQLGKEIVELHGLPAASF
jgi:hypothetical protein